MRMAEGKKEWRKVYMSALVCGICSVPGCMSSWWSEVWWSKGIIFSGLSVSKAIDDCVHHHGLGHSPAVTEELEVES